MIKVVKIGGNVIDDAANGVQDAVDGAANAVEDMLPDADNGKIEDLDSDYLDIAATVIEHRLGLGE